MESSNRMSLRHGLDRISTRSDGVALTTRSGWSEVEIRAVANILSHHPQKCNRTTHLTRLPYQTTSSRWQVDKEAIGLSRVQQFSHLCVARPYQILCVARPYQIIFIKLLILFLNIFTLLALTQSFGSLDICGETALVVSTRKTQLNLRQVFDT